MVVTPLISPYAEVGILAAIDWDKGSMQLTIYLNKYNVNYRLFLENLYQSFLKKIKHNNNRKKIK